MNPRQFWIQLGIITSFTILILLGLNQIEALKPYADFSWICLAAFMGITVFMFLIGEKSAQSPNKNAFTSAALGFIMGKMMLAVIVILTYNKFAEPESKIFIVPFFIVYIIYTIFETYFMMKLAKH